MGTASVGACPAGVRRPVGDRADRPEGYPTQKECAVTPENSTAEQPPKDGADRLVMGAEKLGSLDVWARSAPIRLAGYEDDLAEPHILQSID